ncbi:uncharacterized protein IUM83_12868 [Phytophthora cinnamomi]|uniref:uncharacterized protein n=1 Tax=Phytophthora cinnamomi TaxID=4785 RepID=UPI00355986E1|nr:hypothetical protein IUM83_12868 [Phytophthora cinnamomi]
MLTPTSIRSNKKRNCKSHVPRSYCGCSLHLLVSFESAEAATAAEHNNELLVCARFEAAVVSNARDVTTAMLESSNVALPSSVLQKVDAAETRGDWVQAKKAEFTLPRQFPDNTILYVLNDHHSPQWRYDYSSGFAKRKRDMKHVLAAVANERVEEVDGKYNIYQRDDDDGRGTRPAMLIAHTHLQSSWRSSSSPQVPDVPFTSQMARSQLRLELERPDPSIVQHETIELLRPMLLLQRFVAAIPLDAIGFYFDRIQHRWLAKIAPTDPSPPLDMRMTAAAGALVAALPMDQPREKHVSSQMKSWPNDRQLRITFKLIELPTDLLVGNLARPVEQNVEQLQNLQ